MVREIENRRKTFKRSHHFLARGASAGGQFDEEFGKNKNSRGGSSQVSEKIDLADKRQRQES